AVGVPRGGRLAAPADLGCPDQFWYVCPARASPPGPVTTGGQPAAPAPVNPAVPADGSACQAGYIRVRGGTPFRLCESAQRSTERGGCMQAAIGDRLLIRGNCVGTPDKCGEIVEVHGKAGEPPYLVRFGDGHIGVVFPGPAALVEAKARGGGARKAASGAKATGRGKGTAGAGAKRGATRKKSGSK